MDNILHWISSSGEIELEFTQWHIDNQPVQGDCESSVEEALKYKPDGIEPLNVQLYNLSANDKTIIDVAIKYGCKDYGAEGTPTIREAMVFIVWIAIGDLQEQQTQEG